ncbi:saccharopine dehydrogenase NADP-binding domain-containing protein [uncultured Psychrosphaera sp.]|uniref:saccharopine dehydrogenase family protein n=1 Tax=uncultured Psychrosphaera sp. TaxID=1403522 RepID=UPI0030F685FA
MKFDIVVWGATSFVGQLVAEYLVEHYVKKGELNIAFAGRNKQKLESLAHKLNVPTLPILIGEAQDETFLTELAKQTKLIISTVGPYALYGEPLIKACVEQGIDYCDLTGEPQWIWLMLQRYEAAAKASGARIMHCCGFDSIPSDLGVLKLQQLAMQTHSQPCQQIHYRFKNSKGGISGGTFASMLTALEQIGKDKKQARVLKTPYSLMSEKVDNMPYQTAVKGLEKDPVSGQYLAPFIMASINTKIVHRTNSLLGMPWGKDFLYDEAMQLGAGFKGWRKGIALVSGLLTFGVLASFSFTRSILQRYIVPKPGQGPTMDTVKNGFFNVELYGSTANGGKVTLKVTGQGDPGYGSTCQMISETAILLLQKTPEQTGVGFITPASGLGLDLVDRLQKHAQVTFTQLSVD